MTEPKFQYSRMSPDRSEQIVVRGDDYTEWKSNIELAKSVVPQGSAFPDDTGYLATPQTKVLGNCKDCGSPNTVYQKSGKIGCSKYCWRK